MERNFADIRDVPPNNTNVIQMTVLHINRAIKSSR